MEKEVQTKRHKKIRWREEIEGWVCIAPVVLGILFFTAIPIIYAFISSFFETMLKPFSWTDWGVFVGLKNYTKIFTEYYYSSQFWQAMKVTFVYTLISIPLNLVLGFSLALFLNRDVKGIRFLRALYYLPCLIPAVCSGVLWSQLTNPNYGVMNTILSSIGLKWQWFESAKTAMPSFFMIQLFGLGGGMILWISQIKNVPKALYESAQLDGASKLRQLLVITVPMCSPMILYNLMMGIIGSLQIYDLAASVVVSGGPRNSLLFYVVYIYGQRMTEFGYACALSFILFFITAILSFIVMKTSKWVYYTEES